MHWIIVAYNYPTPVRPHYGVFVRNFVRALSRHGIQCTVVNPTSLFHLRFGPLPPVCTEEKVAGGHPIRVIHPKYISFSDKRIGKASTELLTQLSYYLAARAAVLDILNYSHANLMYAHFLYPSGAVVARLSKQLGFPSVVGVGEDHFTDLTFRHRLYRRWWDVREVSAVVAVSTLNKNRCVHELGIDPRKILLLPNGVDRSLFHPRDQLAGRKKFELPLGDLIVIFVGYFERRKGPDRVVAASRGLKNVSVALVGTGPLRPDGEHVCFRGPVPHAQLPEILSAADIFVLPTLSEGSCNAILEAMACGLPIVTSKGAFNDDIVNASVAIRVDPLDIQEIRDAIIALSTQPSLRAKMGAAALRHASQFDIGKRVSKLIHWLTDQSILGSTFSESQMPNQAMKPNP